MHGWGMAFLGLLLGSAPAEPIPAIAIDPSGRWVATSQGQWTRIWDVASEKELLQLKTVQEEGEPLLAWSGDGRWLALARKKTLLVWRTDSWQEHYTYSNQAPITTLSWGQHLLAWGSEDGKARVWSPQQRNDPVEMGRSNEGGVTALAWRPGRQWLAVGRASGKIEVVDVPSLSSHWQATGHTGPVRAMTWMPDRGQLVSGGDGLVVKWDERSPRRRMVKRTGQEIRALDWYPARGLLAIGGTQGITIESDRARPIELEPEIPISLLRWNAATDQLYAVGTGSAVRVFRLGDTHAVERFAHPAGSQLRVRAVAWSEDEQRLAVGTLDGQVRVWTKQGQEVLAHDHTLAVRSLAWSKKGEGDRAGLASLDVGGSVRLWNGTERPDGQVPIKTSRVCALDWDGQLLLTSREAGIQAWNDRRMPAHLPADMAPRLIACTGNGEIHVWNERGVGVLKHKADVMAWGQSVAWSGSRLAWVERHGQVWLWDGAAGGPPKQWEDVRNASAVALSRDGNWLAIGSMKGDVQVWNVSTKQGWSWEPVKSLAAVRSGPDLPPVTALAFTKSATQVASGSDDGVVLWQYTQPSAAPGQEWEVEPEQELAAPTPPAPTPPTATAPDTPPPEEPSAPPAKAPTPESSHPVTTNSAREPVQHASPPMEASWWRDGNPTILGFALMAALGLWMLLKRLLFWGLTRLNPRKLPLARMSSFDKLLQSTGSRTQWLEHMEVDSRRWELLVEASRGDATRALTCVALRLEGVVAEKLAVAPFHALHLPRLLWCFPVGRPEHLWLTLVDEEPSVRKTEELMGVSTNGIALVIERHVRSRGNRRQKTQQESPSELRDRGLNIIPFTSEEFRDFLLAQEPKTLVLQKLRSRFRCPAEQLSPYRLRAWNPGMFFGRQAELTQLTEGLQKHRNHVLLGPAQVGKTWLLKELESRLAREQEDPWQVQYLRLLGPESFQQLERTQSRLASSALEASQRRVVLVDDADELFTAAVEGSKGRQASIIIQQMQELAEQERACFVLAGRGQSRDALAMADGLEGFETIHLRGLDIEEAMHLVRWPMRTLGFEWTAAHRHCKALVAQTKGHPAWLVITCHGLIRRLEAGSKTEITGDLLEEVLEEDFHSHTWRSPNLLVNVTMALVLTGTDEPEDILRTLKKNAGVSRELFEETLARCWLSGLIDAPWPRALGQPRVRAIPLVERHLKKVCEAWLEEDLLLLRHSLGKGG